LLLQVDILLIIKAMNKVMIRSNHINTTLVQNTSEKKKNEENGNKLSFLKSSCPGELLLKLQPLI